MNVPEAFFVHNYLKIMVLCALLKNNIIIEKFAEVPF